MLTATPIASAAAPAPAVQEAAGTPSEALLNECHLYCFDPSTGDVTRLLSCPRSHWKKTWDMVTALHMNPPPQLVEAVKLSRIYSGTAPGRPGTAVMVLAVDEEAYGYFIRERKAKAMPELPAVFSSITVLADHMGMAAPNLHQKLKCLQGDDPKPDTVVRGVTIKLLDAGVRD